MTREEFTIFINSLEEKYPVNQWEIEGVKLWPLIKIRLSFSFHSNYNPESQNSNSEAITLKVKKVFSGLFQLAKIYMKRKSQTPTKLFFLAPHFRYYDGKKYTNRYFNQLIEDSKKEANDFLMGEYANTTKEYRKSIDYPEQIIYLENLKYLSLFLREFTWKKYTNNANWSEFEDFLTEVREIVRVNNISKNAIIKQFIYIKILKNFYNKVLSKNNINEVYILCYYVSETYAMNLATSKLGIISWDIQHGGQGIMHLAYTNFNVIPKTGYKLLPKKFWVWDAASASEINKWISHQEFHQVEVKGNPWIEYCVKRYTAEIDASKKIILYTMQPVGEHLLDPYIIETIEKTPLDYIWWLRLHPRQLAQKDNLKKLLAENNIMDRVNFEDAVSLPLPAILSKAHVHISKYSGSVLEAYMMNVKSIILSEIGVKSFPEVVKSEYGITHLQEDSNILLEEILHI